MSSDVAIRVKNLSKCYQVYDSPRDRLKQFVLPRLQRTFRSELHNYYREFWALKDVSFEIRRGETVGIVGRNGSGKSTLLQMICGTLNPTSGEIKTNGRIAALLELGSGFNPEFTGRENVYMNGALLGLSKGEIDVRFDDIASFADVGDFIDQPVKNFSSGMYVRLAFAIAINVHPDILIIDEALSVGDIRFQAKCIRKIQEIQSNGASILFVSHSAGQVEALCGRAIWLNEGVIKADDQPKNLMRQYVNFMMHGIDEEEGKRTKLDNKLQANEVSKCDMSRWKTIGARNNIKGNFAAVITKVLVRGGDGKIANVILSVSQKIRITFTLIAKEKVHAPLIATGIFNHLSEPILHFNNENMGVAIPELAEGTEHTFDIVVNVPALRPGEYLISIGIDDGLPHASSVLCHVYDAWALKVTLPEGSKQQGGYIQIEDTSKSITHKVGA